MRELPGKSEKEVPREEELKLIAELYRHYTIVLETMVRTCSEWASFIEHLRQVEAMLEKRVWVTLG